MLFTLIPECFIFFCVELHFMTVICDILNRILCEVCWNAHNLTFYHFRTASNSTRFIAFIMRHLLAVNLFKQLRFRNTCQVFLLPQTFSKTVWLANNRSTQYITSRPLSVS